MLSLSVSGIIRGFSKSSIRILTYQVRLDGYWSIVDRIFRKSVMLLMELPLGWK